MCLGGWGAAGCRLIPSTSGAVRAGCYREGDISGTATGCDRGGNGRSSRSRFDDHIQCDDAVATCCIGKSDGLLSFAFNGGAGVRIWQLIAA